MNNPEWIVEITPHDPLIARDGRPFDVGIRARSLDWVYPSVSSGTLRTLIGKASAADGENPFTDKAHLEKLIQTFTFEGPFPANFAPEGTQMFVPAPKDAYVLDAAPSDSRSHDELRAVPLRPRPFRENEGCDLIPERRLLPVLPPETMQELPKPAAGAPPFWSYERFVDWLADDAARRPETEPFLLHPSDGLRPVKEVRYHTRISPTGTADDTHLFTTSGLVFYPDVSPGGRGMTGMVASVRSETADADLSRWFRNGIETLHPMGGERRLAAFRFRTAASGCPKPWSVDDRLIRKFKEKSDRPRGLRMVLATPAVFETGCIPEWIDTATLIGSPPGMERLKLKWRGASIDRWKPISGWNMALRGPKPVMRAVPAGGVYFFEIVEPDGLSWDDLLPALWFRPVGLFRQRDGFGLAAWGVWDSDGPHA